MREEEIRRLTPQKVYRRRPSLAREPNVVKFKETLRHYLASTVNSVTHSCQWGTAVIESDRPSWQMHSCFPQTTVSSAFRVSRRSQATLWWKTLRRNNSTSLGSGPELADVSWKRLGVPASVAATLRSVFPHIAKPTKTQARLIPAILSGKDVLLKDHTGTGKCVESHILVTAQRSSDKSTELQVIWLNLSLA